MNIADFKAVVFTSGVLQNIVITLVLLVLFYGIKILLYRKVDKTTIKGRNVQETLLVKKKISQTLQYVLLFLLLFIWLYQYKEALFSLVAVAAAIVIALKELIMCFTGGLLLKVSGAFDIGDRIEIDNIRGFVIDKSMLTFKILEIGPEKYSQQTTGDVITLPNSLVLDNAIKNESYFKGYSIKTFNFFIADKQKFDIYEKEMIKEACAITITYIDEAKINISKFCQKEKLDLPSIEPRSKIYLDDDKLHLLIKMPVKSSIIADIEQRLFRKYLEIGCKD